MPRDRYEDGDDDRSDRRWDDDRPRRRRSDDSDADFDRPRRRRDYDDDPPAKSGGGKTVLLVLCIVGGVLLVCGGLAGVGFYFAFNKTQVAAARMKSSNNLKMAGLTEFDFESRTGAFSRPYLDTDDRGLPVQVPQDTSSRLSWRVAMLPYMYDGDASATYRRFKLTEAWDGPTNGSLRNTPINAYLNPLDGKDGEPTTRIRCFYDNGAMFDSRPEVKFSPINITDGSSNTIMFVEAAERVPWTQFNELKFNPNGPLPALGHPSIPGGFNALFADGSVRFIRSTASPEAIKAAITCNGGEVMPLDD